MMEADEVETVMWQGRFITAKTRGKWEYVSRARGIKAAVILAMEDDHVLLVEQYRVPLRANCIELPAGLIGDHEEGEDTLVSAARELEEETGLFWLEGQQIGYVDSPRGKYGCVMFRCTKWDGAPKIMEPIKLPAIGWFHKDNLPENLTIDTLASIEAGCLTIQ
jgi:ADP-ribose pyrophosphatase YjhB (NUDIX family)